ncbi:MAG: hypothetical protein ACPG19_12090 [Saprospiraceae bacterium]
MKNPLILFLLSFNLFIGCQPSMIIKADDYQKLTSTDNLDQYLNKKVQFDAMICQFEMQHILVPNLNGESTYICLDRLNNEEELGDQILAYSADKNILSKSYRGGKFIVFGTIHAISGAGKGGGIHKEYYLKLYGIDF